MTRSSDCDLLIVGGGPCGLAAAISAQRTGLQAVVVEGASVVSTIAHYPTYVRFFSTAEKLSLGDMPFVIATEKPTRRDGLAYYRAVVKHFAIPLRRNIDGFSLSGRKGYSISVSSGHIFSILGDIPKLFQLF